MKKITRHTQSQLRSVRQPPSSGQRPRLVTRQNVTTAKQELIDYHHRFEPFFRRHEQSDWSWFYLCGQLSNLERKTIEPMVLSLWGAIPNAIRDVQRFMSQSPWESRPPMVHLQSLVAKWLGERDAVAIVDGNGFPKQGKHSIGPAQRISDMAMGFDREIAHHGSAAGARWLLPHFVSAHTACGEDRIPDEGPLLIVSNHPAS